MEGNIVVDGVLASCYATVNHDLAHIGMTPVQLLPDFVQWIFSEEDGFSAFAKTIQYLRRAILPYGQTQHY